MAAPGEILNLIRAVDSFDEARRCDYYTLIAHDGSTELGLMIKLIALLFHEQTEVMVDLERKTVTIPSQWDSIEKRSHEFEVIASRWRNMNQFKESLSHGWRNELYVVYCPSRTPYMLIERAFSVLIGVVTYGIHVNGYVPASRTTDGQLKMWVPTRAMTKPTFPGKLDNTVAGGLGHPHGVFDTVIKECWEEAGLEGDFVVHNVKAVGQCLYNYVAEEGHVQPEVQYVFDLEFPNESDIVPKPMDGEAENFRLMTVPEIMRRLLGGEFKPNCGLIVIDFMIRHGFILRTSEQDFDEICARSHRVFRYPVRVD